MMMMFIAVDYGPLLIFDKSSRSQESISMNRTCKSLDNDISFQICDLRLLPLLPLEVKDTIMLMLMLRRF